MSGLKCVDNLIEKYGISANAQNNSFIQRKCLQRIDAQTCGLPFCFYRRIEALEAGESVWCFTVSIPGKKQKLAAYLVDTNAQIIEQVYYPRDRKSVQSCEKIKRLLCKSLSECNVSDYHLAA